MPRYQLVGSYQTQHVVSQFLKDRHPYDPDKSIQHFAHYPHPHEIATAFGYRATEKYIALFYVEGLPFDGRYKALSDFYDLLSVQEQKMDAIGCGCIQACINGLRWDWPQDPRCASKACQILASCFMLQPGRELIDNDEGVIDTLDKMLIHPDHTVRESAAMAFESLSNYKDGVQRIINQNNIIPHLVDAINDENRENQSQPRSLMSISHIVQMYVNLTTYSNGCVPSLECPIVRNLMNCLKGESFGLVFPTEDDRIDLYCKAIQCLWNLGNELEGKRQEVEQHTIEVIIEILKKYMKVEEVQRVWSGCIMALSVNEDAKRLVYTCNACQYLSLLAEHGLSEGIKNNAKVAIRNIQENADARKQFLLQLVHHRDISLEVFDWRICRLLNDLLVNSKHCQNALHIFVSIIDDEKLNESAYNALYITENIINIMKKNDNTEQIDKEGTYFLKRLLESNNHSVLVLKDRLTDELSNKLKSLDDQIMEIYEQRLKKIEDEYS